MIWIGTSGFQYPEWKGSFYPATLSTAKMLPFYAERFPTTEINYSFRRIPSAKTLANWSALTPEKFRFGFKALQEITHIKRLCNCEGLLATFCEALMRINEKLGPVLFQLPPFFKKDLPLLKDFLGALPKELNCAFEFRHSSWFDEETFSALKSRNAALCISESEKLATPLAFTANFGYLRLRREDYASKDISRWAKVIREHQSQLSDIYVYFKHEETGTGPKCAKQLISELGV